MVLPKVRKATKNHKSTRINFPQQTESKKDKKTSNLEKVKWTDQKKVKPVTRKEFRD